MPASYMVDGRAKFRRDSAWWAFRQVSQLAFFRWQDMVKDIEKCAADRREGLADQRRSRRAVALYKQTGKTALSHQVLARHGQWRGGRLLEAGETSGASTRTVLARERDRIQGEGEEGPPAETATRAESDLSPMP